MAAAFDTLGRCAQDLSRCSIWLGSSEGANINDVERTLRNTREMTKIADAKCVLSQTYVRAHWGAPSDRHLAGSSRRVDVLSMFHV